VLEKTRLGLYVGGQVKIIIPVRCFTCGKLIADKWEEFTKRVKNGEDPKKVLDSLGFTRYCCRRMILSHIEISDNILRFYEEKEKLKSSQPF
jgi:DNA-directed RNA polymerase subunit N